jgi:(heptosyl)LPS beta-1,4-glucosyltransferase
MNKISAIIHTKNEERNIAQAIRSVLWADEVLVVDMESTDRTVAIAQDLGARILPVPNADYADPARAAGIRAASYPWIVYIDADELMPQQLAVRLRSLADQPGADAYMLPRANYMFGHLIAHAGWGADQDKQFRFFRRDALEVHPDIHRKPSLIPGKKMMVLKEKDVPPIVHFNYTDANQFLTKMQRYTDIEAKAIQPGEPGILRIALAAGKEFVLRYFVLQGFRDGWQGLYLALLMVTYRATALAKAAEIAERQQFGTIEIRYEQIAAQVLKEYDARER